MKKTLIVLMMVIVAVSLFVGCKNEPEAKTYKVGDTGPAGGTIFYVNPNAEEDGWTYLEAAPTCLGEYKWGSDGADYNTEEGVGKGKSNTDKLMEKATESITFPAAQACYDYEYTNPETGVKYDDWFLPSKGEMDMLYTVKDKLDSASLNKEYFWTSTGYSNDVAKEKNLKNGNWYGQNRTDSFYVWPVRAF